MFYGVPNNIVICLSGNNNTIFDQLNRNCETNYCSKNWQLNQKKYIDDQCFEQCYMNDRYKYDYNGKCFEACANGEYQDEFNTSIIRCKCELEKCLSCPPEALKQDLCDKCNTGFYPMENDPLNKEEYINCYDKIEGY